MTEQKARELELRNLQQAFEANGKPASFVGDETKADAMQKLLEAFGILELVRTGMVALERGAYTIGDETKEQTEFNLGKNFL